MQKKKSKYQCTSGCSQTTFTVLEILSFLNEVDEFCVNDVLEIFQIDRQAFMRHFKSIRHYFLEKYNKEIAQSTTRGCFRIINKEVFLQALNFGDSKELLSYIHILQEVLPHYYHKLDESVKKRLKKENMSVKSIYHFYNPAREKKVNPELLSQVEKSVRYRRKVNIQYQGKTKLKDYLNVKPLKIVYMEGNLYVAVLEETNFMLLRIYLIKKYEFLDETYNEIPIVQDALNFAISFQTPFDVFGKTKTKVSLIVRKKYAKHFLQKKYLSSQREEKLEDGRLRLFFEVTNYKEIIPLVKKWLPNIYIEEPKEWNEKFQEELHDYLLKRP